MKKVPLLLFFITCLILIPVRICRSEPTTLGISKKTEAEAVSISKENWLKEFYKDRKDFEEKYGLEYAFVLNYAQQVILRNSRDVGNSRSTWYWNLALSQRLWQGASVITELEVDKNKGIDKFIPTYSLFNSNAGDNASLYIPKFMLEQNLRGDEIYLAAGKLDLSDWFDTNEVANSSDLQFLSNALVNNYTIPFPPKGIGAAAIFKPNDWLYLQAGASTAESNAAKIGLSNAFNSTLFLNEFAFTPKIKDLQGNYRFIFYLLHHKLVHIMDEAQNKNNHFGFSFSFDQQVTKRITLFTRYGFADKKVNDIQFAWSAGGQITEPIPGRKFDCLGLGVAQNILSRDYRAYSDSSITASRETMLEAYYSLFLEDYLTITSDLQFVVDPCADKSAQNPLVASVRFLVVF